MGLTVCQDCGGKVSTGAGTCPHCGRPNVAATAKPIHWYVLRDGKPDGPHTTDALREMVGSGQVGADTKVNKAGDEAWMPVASVVEPQPSSSQPPPAATPAGGGATFDAVVAAVAIISTCAVFGYLLGRYYPVFSSHMVLNLCEVDSPCRAQSAIAYAIGGGLAGVVLAVLNQLLRQRRAS